MKGIKFCNLLSIGEINDIISIINEQLISGNKDTAEMIKDFWINSLNDPGINYASKVSLLSNYMKVLGVLLPSYSFSSDVERIELSEGVDQTELTRIYNIMNDFGPLEGDQADIASKIDQYIQNEFINPFVPAGTIESDETEIETEEVLPVNTVVEEQINEEEGNSDPLKDKAEQDALDQDLFEGQDESETDSSFDFSDYGFVGDSANHIADLKDRQNKKGYVAINHLTEILFFRYDPVTNTLREYIPYLEGKEVVGKEMSLESFIDTYKGDKYVTSPSHVEVDRQNKDQKNASLRIYYKNVIERFTKSLATFYGNTVKKEKRDSPLFSFENGEFSVGDLALDFGSRNRYFSKIFKKTTGRTAATVKLDKVSTESLFGKGSRVFMEVNDDPSLEKKQLVLTVKNGDNDVAVIGNIFDVESRELFKDVDNKGKDYMDFVDSKIKEIESTKNKSIDVTDMGLRINEIFLPAQKRHESNKIYRNDKDRFGKDSNVEKAENLSLTNGRKLLEAMGYGVSKPMVDKNISGSKSPGGSFIAVSPFHTAESINRILENAFKKEPGSDASTFEAINKKHNISFIYLERKKLKLDDYLKLTRNNITVRGMRDSDGNKQTDSGKLQSMFNVGQSALIHFRMATSIAYLEKVQKKTKDENLKRNIILLKLYLFNDQNYYGTDQETINRLNDFKKVFNKFYTSQTVEISADIIQTAERNYQNWLDMAGEQNKNGRNRQLDRSKEIAGRLFGYYPKMDSDNEFDRTLIENKLKWARYQSKGDPTQENNFRRKGGIFGNVVMLALQDISKYRNEKIGDQTLEEAFDNEDMYIADIRVQNEVSAMTFNPVTENKEDRGGFIGKDASSVLPLQSEVNGDNLVEDYLELPYLPLQPHLRIDISALMGKPEDGSAKVSGPKNRRKSNLDMDFEAQKTVDGQQMIDESDYALTESEALELYASLLGDLKGKLEAMSSPIVVKEGIVVGSVAKDIMRLLSINGKFSEKTLRHEIMHRLVNEILSSDTRRKLYSEAKNRILQTESSPYTSLDQISDKIADEFLAEHFEKNHVNYRSKLVKKLPKIIQDFLFTLQEIYLRARGTLSYIDLVSKRLESGNYINSSLTQNSYKGKDTNKMIKFSVKKLALKFNNDLSMGTRMMETQVKTVASNVQDRLYGNQVALGMLAQDMNNPVKDHTVPMSYREAIEEVREDFGFYIEEFLETDPDLMDPDMVLLDGEREIFLEAGSTDDAFTIESEINDQFWGPRIKENLTDIVYEGLSDNAKKLYNAIVTYRNFDKLVKIGMPFVDLSPIKPNNVADHEIEANEASLETVENEIEETLSSEANNLIGDKLRNSFERSEISAYGTFTEKVKFFLYNTKQYGSRNLVNRKHVDMFFSLVINDTMQTSPDGVFSVEYFLDSAKRNLDRLDPLKNGGDYELSEAYRSVRGIYDRFFGEAIYDSEGKKINRYSFLEIAMMSDPRFERQAQAHSDVLAAIISAQKSVVQQNFMKTDRGKISETEVPASVNVKNSIKDSVIFTLFEAKNTSNRIIYQLSSRAKTLYFSNERYRTGEVDKGVSFSIGEKSITITQKDIKKSSGMSDFKPAFLNDVLTLFPNDSDLFLALNEMGFDMNKEFFDSIISEDGERSGRNSKRKAFADIIVHGYFILAKQYVSENSENHGFGANTLKLINSLGEKRNENIHKIVNQSLRRDMAFQSLKEGESMESLDEKSDFNSFTPTVLYNRISKLVSSSALTDYEKKNNIVFLLDGSKEVVDKYPTTMHRVFNRFKDMGLKIQESFESYKNTLDPESKTEPRLDDFLFEKFKGIHSSLYKNPIISGDLSVSDVLYYKGTKNNKTNNSRSYDNMTEAEFFIETLGFMIGDGLNKTYYHPLEIQANRSFLVTTKVKGGNERSSARYNPTKKGNDFVPDQVSMNALQNIRMLPFHHARNIMEEAYTVMGETEMAAKASRLQSERSIIAAFREYEKTLNEKIKENPFIVDQLTNRKHYIRIKGEYEVSPLLMKKMTMGEKGFMENFMQKYLEFAEYTYGILGNIDISNDSKLFLTESMLGDIAVMKDERFITEKKKIKWFGDIRKTADYDSLSSQEKINEYHPALMSMFMTYYINQTAIAQSTTGDPYLYKPDAATGFDNEHSYITDLVKRQAGFTTPKIEGVYREVITVNGEQKIFNKNAMGPTANIAYVADNVFDPQKESSEFMQSYIKANSLTADHNGDFRVRQEATDGWIATNPIAQSLLKKSYGDGNGMNVGSFIKFILHAFDQKTGDLHIPKGLAQVINGDFISNTSEYSKGLLRLMYSPVTVNSPDYGTMNLFVLYETLVQEFDNDYNRADAELVAIYNLARNNEQGHSMTGDIIHYLSALSANKGASTGVNRINPDGTLVIDRPIFSTVSNEGFGVILDLQKDINKTKNEVALSTQMLFLMGINKENYRKSNVLYRKISEMSGIEMEKISMEIAKEISGSVPDLPNVIENKEAVRTWMIKEIKHSFEQKNDYGLIYQLVEDVAGASISNPLLFEEIFQKVGSRFNKTIKLKMEGFKSVHAPAYNTVMLYPVPVKRIDGTETLQWLTKKDLTIRGISPDESLARNSKYSYSNGETLTDTEIFTGNVFAGKYNIPEQLTLSQVFDIVVDGQSYNMEADNFSDISSNNIINKGSGRFTVLKEMAKSGSKVDWNSSPVVLAMINTKKINEELVKKLIEGETLTLQENIKMSDEYAKMAMEMNRMLYGVVTRIPSTGKNSTSPIRIKGFVNGYKNGSFLPSEWFLISGADNDGDTVQFWHYSDKNEIENEMLTTVRGVLQDINNENEIFAAIDLSYIEGLSQEKKSALVQEGLGYVHGSLKTVSQIKTNNSIGNQQTGINATQSKVHSYALIASSIARDLWSMAAQKGRKNGTIQKVMDRPVNNFFTKDSEGNLKEINSGPLFRNEKGDAVDSNGNFVYKWNEMITNGAIDNAKHLFMDALNLNRYNSSIQQAMTFMGFPKETIVEFLKNPIAVKVFRRMEATDNSSNDFIENMLTSMKKVKIGEKRGAEFLRDILEKEPGSDMSVASKAKLISYFENKSWEINFSDVNDVFAFMLVMEKIGDEINEIRKVIKVTDDIGGKSSKQEFNLEELINAVNMGFAPSNSLVTPRALKNFLESVSDYRVRNHFTHMDQTIRVNPFDNKRIQDAMERSFLIHPLVVLASVPHIRQFAMNHLDFNRTKETHLLDNPIFHGLKKEVFKNIEERHLKLERNRGKIVKSIFKMVNSRYLKSIGSIEFINSVYDLDSVKDIAQFRKDFGTYILEAKTNTDNYFLKRIEVSPDNISFPSSEKMDEIMRQGPRAEFAKLPKSVQMGFFIYELTSSDTQIQYKNGSMVPFFNEFVFRGYNAFLRENEIAQSILTSAQQGRDFVKAFAYENPSLMRRVRNFDANLRDLNGEFKKGYIFDTQAFKKEKSYPLKSKKIRGFDIGFFSNESVKEASELQKEINEYESAVKDAVNAYNSLSKTEVLTNEQKNTMNQLAELIRLNRMVVNEKINEMERILHAKKTVEGSPEFRVIKGYIDSTKQFTTRLYKVRELTPEESVKLPKSPAGDPVFNTVMEEVFYPFDKSVNLYHFEGNIPTVTDKDKIINSIEELSQKHSETPLAPGTYYTSSDFTKVEIVEGIEKPITKKFSFKNTKGKPASKRKIKAVVSLLRKSFPNIDIQLTSGLTGIYGKASGFVHQNTVYLNMDNIGLDTPVHEFGHIFIDILERSNFEMFSKISALVERSNLFTDISKKYVKLGNNENDNIKETFVTMLGEYFETNSTSMMDGLGQSEKNRMITLFNEFIDFIRNSIKGILLSSDIDKKYINDKLISSIDKSSDLDTIFMAISGTVLSGNVITEFSTNELNEYAQILGEPRVSDAEVDRVIFDLMEKGIVKNYC